MFEYHSFKHETLTAIADIGKLINPGSQYAGMNRTQRERARASNFTTDERWQWRKLAGGSLIVEVSYGWMMKNPIIGLTVFCVGKLAGDAKDWDFSLSGCFHDIPSLVARMTELHEGGPLRIAALAEQGV